MRKNLGRKNSPYTHISPAIPKEPDRGAMPGISIQSRNIFRLPRISALTGPDLRLRAVDLDVTGLTAGVWFAWVGAADIGDFEHHVCLPVFVPERDADIRSAIPCFKIRLSTSRSNIA